MAPSSQDKMRRSHSQGTPHLQDSALRDPLFHIPSKLSLKRSLFDLLEVVRRGKWLILGIALLVIGIAAYYTYTAPRIYQADSLLMINLSSKPNDALNSGYIEPFDLRDLSNQEIILQQSLPIALRTVERLRELGTVPGTDQPFPILEAGMMLPDEALARMLQDGYIRIRPASHRTSAYQITAVSTLPAEAAFLANIYAEEYVTRALEHSRQRITGSRRFLETQLAERRKELEFLEEQIKRYQSDQRAVGLETESNHLVSQRAQLDIALDEVRIDISMREASLNALTKELEQIQPRLARHVASSVKTEIDQSQEKIAELELLVEQIYARNPELRNSAATNGPLHQLNSQIDQLKQRVAVLSEQYLQETMAVGGMTSKEAGLAHVAQLQQKLAAERIALNGARAKAAAIEQRKAEYAQKLSNIPAQALDLTQLRRAQRSAEQLYLQLEDKLQEVQIAEESEIGFARIIRPASVPLFPISPNKSKNLSLGLVLGLMLGFAAAVARAGLDTRIHTPDDLRKSGLNLLGTVPDMRELIKQEFGGKPTLSSNDLEISTTLVSLLNPMSPPAQAYRQLYLNLQFSRPDLDVQTLLVTSPEAEVGKSTTALNLAATMAQASRRTLLIDTDLYHPSISNYLGLPAHQDLESVLAEDVAELAPSRFATNIDNLYVIASANPAENPARLVGSKKMREFLHAFGTQFDMIIIDAPPVLATTEAILLSTQADATILVTLAGKTDDRALKQSVEELEDVGATIIGAVLNGFNPSKVLGYKHTYGYKSKYYYQYKQTTKRSAAKEDKQLAGANGHTAKGYLKKKLFRGRTMTPNSQYLPVVLFLLSFALAVPSTQAQAQAEALGSFGRIEQLNTNVSSYYYHSNPGAATVQVFVYGTVRAPGVYELETGTDLGKLLALAGGPILQAREKGSRRKITLMLMRPSRGSEEPLYEATLEQALSGQTQYPVLIDGDVLVVDTVERRKFVWQDALSIISTAATISWAVTRFIR